MADHDLLDRLQRRFDGPPPERLRVAALYDVDVATLGLRRRLAELDLLARNAVSAAARRRTRLANMHAARLLADARLRSLAEDLRIYRDAAAALVQAIQVGMTSLGVRVRGE